MLLSLLALLAGPADTVRLRVLSINDFHGALEPRAYAWSGGRGVGGLAGLRHMMDSLEADCSCPTVRLDAGDEMQGTLLSNLVSGRSSVEGLNLLGLDAAAIGNHDLDWGTDSLRSRQRDARYASLAANVFDSVTGRRPDWAQPYTVLPVRGLRIAVIGYLTAETKSIVLAEHVAGLEFRGGVEPLREVLADVARVRPDFTIIVAHAGAFCDSLACRGEIVDLARDLPAGAVDLIVSGHTHSLVNTIVNGIPVVQSWSSGRAIGLSDLVRVGGGRSSAVVRVETAWAHGADAAVTSLLERYRPRVAAVAGRVVATLRDTLFRSGDQYALGNLIAAAQRTAAGADVGLINNGGIRTDLPAGPVTSGQLFELQPFQNQVVRIPVPGSILLAVLEQALVDGHPDAHLDGVTVRWDPAKPPGQRVVEARLDDGRRVEPDGRYSLGTANFLATGGGGYRMLAPLAWERVVGVDLEVLERYLAAGPQPVVAPAAPRFVVAKR